MEIEQYLWGASAEGEGILLYTLRCAGGREVRLSNAGAAVTGIFAAGADGRPEALTPVFETPEALLADYADRGKTQREYLRRSQRLRISEGSVKFILNIAEREDLDAVEDTRFPR